jgi:hypothetical protein
LPQIAAGRTKAISFIASTSPVATASCFGGADDARRAVGWTIAMQLAERFTVAGAIIAGL